MDQVNEILSKMTDAAEKYGPDAVYVAGRLAQAQYAGYLMTAIMIIGIMWVGRNIILNRVQPSGEEDAAFVYWASTIIASIISLMAIMDTLFRPLWWIAAFDPKMALAVKALELVGGK